MSSRVKSPYSGRGMDRRVSEQAHILDHYPGPVALFDESGTLVYSNRARSQDASEGWIARVPLGTHLSQLAERAGFDDSQLDETRDGIADVIAGNTNRFELDYVVPGGTGNRWYRVVVTPTQEFAPRGALVLHHDLTESKLTEARLRDSQERLDLALWGSGLGLWDWQVPSGEFRVGDRWLEILGYGRGDLELTFDGIRDLVHPNDRDRMMLALESHFQGRSDVYQSEHRIQTEDGEWKWVLDRGLVVERDQEERPVRATGILLDISERKSLEARLHQANKMEAVGRLAGGVAHDFNNLLTAINGYADLALAVLDEEDTVASHIRAIKRSGERAASLTSRLLAFSRRQILQPRLLDLNGIARNMKKLLEPVIGEDVKLVQRLDPELRGVRADLGQMEQVIMNLAVNARDAMPKGGNLVIETTNVEVGPSQVKELPGFRPGSYVKLAVSDTGTGMDEKTRSRVFEPFFTTKPAGQGTGLGLSMVYGIVKQSDGYTEITSRPRAGTTVNIYLPPAAVHGDLAVTEDTDPVEAPAGDETVLLVEDEGAVRQLLRAVLREKGYEVVEAGSAEEALEVFETSPRAYDLLLTDVVLPGMNGDELARSLKGRVEDLKVLLISGYPRGSIGMQHKLPADTQFLQKPFSPNQLCEKVRGVLDEAPA